MDASFPSKLGRLAYGLYTHAFAIVWFATAMIKQKEKKENKKEKNKEGG